MGYVQRTQMEELSSWPFYITLTYNNESLPKITTSTGYDIRYADIHDVQNMFKRLRKSNVLGRKFSYLAVSELGSTKGRPHFHMLLFLQRKPEDDFNDILNLQSLVFDSVLFEWRRNYGSNRNPVYRPLCTYVRKFVRGRLMTNYDCHYVHPSSSENGISDVGFYVTKYMLKPSNRAVNLQRALRLNLSEDEYEDIWKLVRPRTFTSKHFGLRSDVAVDYLKECVNRSKSNFEYPCFFNSSDGSSFPLARYYKSKGEVFSMMDFLDFYFKSRNGRVDNVVFDDRDIQDKIKSVKRGQIVFDAVEDHDFVGSIFDDLYA